MNFVGMQVLTILKKDILKRHKSVYVKVVQIGKKREFLFI